MVTPTQQVPRWVPSPSRALEAQPPPPPPPEADTDETVLTGGDSVELDFPFNHSRSFASTIDGRANGSRSMSVGRQLDIEAGLSLASSMRAASGGLWRRLAMTASRAASGVDRQASAAEAARLREEAWLTWEDLWARGSSGGVAAGGKGGQVTILRELSGFAAPGEVLAIMGPSGSGKTTLLDALAGRLQPDVRQSGQILINGRKQRLSYGTSAYVTQEDVLMRTLTVREAVCYSAQLQLPDWMGKKGKDERAEETIKEMGLGDVMDTMIGGNGSGKGVISGGQRRRVSICMEILNRPQILFLDEPTSGLDSAASFHVIRRISTLARLHRMTVVASVHQPSSDVFDIFHRLCLLAYGHTVYFGQSSMTSGFFASNGFPCPALRNPCDHFLKTINKDFDVAVDDVASKPSTTAAAIELLVNSYKSSDACSETLSQITQIHHKGSSELVENKQASFLNQCLVLTRRSFVNMYRDVGYYWLRFAIYIALCITVGTIFYQVGHSYSSIQARGAMLMFVAAFLTFMAIGGFPSFVEDMKVFKRERLNGHYLVMPFVISNTLSSTPYLALISVVPGAIAYYLVGLQGEAGHFFYFAAVLFTTLMLVESLMMIVASIVPDFLMGIITGAGIQGVMMLNGGFFRLPNDLPKPVWRYPMYYIAFHKYANQGFYKNEFLGLTFPAAAGAANTISGEEVLRDFWQVEMGYSKWADLAILLGLVLLYRLAFFSIVSIAEKMSAAKIWAALSSIAGRPTAATK